MKNIVFTLLLACLSAGIQAQSIKQCGTDTSPADDSTYVNLVKQMNQDTSPPVVLAPRYIPVQYHIIRKSDGTGGADVQALDDALLNVSHQFDTILFNFFRCEEPNYIDDDSYFTEVMQGTAAETDLVNNHARTGVVNIYFVPILIDDNGADTICGFSRLPWQGGNYLFVETGCTMDGSTLAHQLGHYFGLYHTHHSSSAIEKEHVTRDTAEVCHNCATAGDLLCDTDADPGLSLATVNGICNYNGLVKDTCNTAVPPQILDYMPNTANFLSFSRKDCRNMYSPGQFKRMEGFYHAARMVQLDPLMCSTSPCFDDVTLPLTTDSVITMIKTFRAANSITSTETIDVTTSPGVMYKAGGFVCLNPGFQTTGGSIFSAFIEECQNFAPGKDEDFLVVPKDNPGLLIAPNPVSNHVTIWFKLPKAGKAHVQVVNATGQSVATLVNGTYDEGLHSVGWNAGDLKVGMYFVLLKHGGKHAVQKMAKLEH